MWRKEEKYDILGLFIESNFGIKKTYKGQEGNFVGQNKITFNAKIQKLG